MHIAHKFCIVTMAALLTFGTAAHAINHIDSDEEDGEVTQAVQSASDVSVEAFAEQKTDLEKAVDTATLQAVTTTSPPVHKLSITANAIKLDGSAVKPAGYNINDENYFKLRDIAYLMNDKTSRFNVGWNKSTSSIVLTKGSAYQKIGGEMQKVSANPKIRESNARVLVNNEAVSMTAYNIDGNNYFRLRDIGSKLGFSVEYDSKSRSILIASPKVETKKYAVTFNMNGAGAQIATKQGVESGNKISAPATPTASGYAFGGWYKDAACKTAWDFSKDTVTNNVTLYAKWVKTYSVTYAMNGHGSQVSTKTGIASGSKITEPAKPTAQGYDFGGWFIDSGCNTPWVFGTDAVTANITLYAMWTQRDSGEDTGTGDGGSTPKRVDGVMTVLVDAGHGGSDPGEMGNGLRENEINLAVAQHLRDLLSASGVKVVMTIDNPNTSLKGNDRIAFVRKEMQKNPFDLCVSVHHNGGGGVGAEVYVQTAAQDPTGSSRDLGNLIIDEYKKLGQTSRGVKTNNLYMVRVPSEFGVPAILSEFAFLDNAADAAKIDSIEEQRAEAQALHNAIMRYFATHSY